MTLAVDKAGGTGGRAGLSDRKREAILKGAKAVFLKQGFGGASMDEVAAAAGVSKMTVYRHFGSKEDLFAGVITELCHLIVTEEIDEIFARPPREALRAFARKMTDIVFARDTAELHRIVIAESRRFPKLGRLFYETGPQVCIDALAGYFIRHKGDPALKVSDPRRAAEEFLELLRGYSHLKMLLGIDKAPAPRDIDARIEAALRHVMV
ncbi:TetR/AcrR family transcriptional regulator [Pseudorhodoplanes sp.]|uniref:TetR/AcrR family transcriptional regulator n=1 Tax=Pseudorhodoplanes sp. TaxID=1934341 RepID=UPI002C2D9120|nr:TetR/AcrR family transcriptional regulator [Pseudorhodoplanes sp.]HWV40147.1 TetR/AcrR family transcriptional regulator [Pseudorhodoplanes sp.]